MQRLTPQDSKAMSSDRLLANVENFVKNKVTDKGIIRSTEICDVAAGETCRMLLGDPKTGFTDPFISFKLDNYLESEPIKKLLAQSNQRENLVFSVSIPSIHVFLIVKINDGKNSSFRIYVAWLGLLSFGQWLGLDPWPESQHDLLKLHQEFNRILTRDEVQSFLKKLITFLVGDPELKQQGYQGEMEMAISHFDPQKLLTIETLEAKSATDSEKKDQPAVAAPTQPATDALKSAAKKPAAGSVAQSGKFKPPGKNLLGDLQPTHRPDSPSPA